MKFRPCIDIHNGKVKQIVGGSLTDVQDQASENFVSEQDASFYAELYKKAGIKGGHVILLNGHDSPYYESTKEQAILALHTYPGGLQIGGGVNPENAGEYLSAGASHVIVTSYVFKDGRISWENLNKMKETVGKEKLVLDLSCRRKDGKYYIVTDRWQKFTDVTMTLDIMKQAYNDGKKYTKIQYASNDLMNQIMEQLKGDLSQQMMEYMKAQSGQEPKETRWEYQPASSVLIVYWE